MIGLHGVMPMLVTPFREDGSIAFEDLVRLIGDQRDAGVTAICALGLAGEAGFLSVEEREAVTRAVIDAGEGLPVVIGCTAQDTETAVRLATVAADAGSAAVMVAPPSLPGWSRDRLSAHYGAVAQAVSDTPVMVQDAPVFVGVALDAAFVLELANEHANVRLAKPESLPAADAVAELAEMSTVSVFGGHGGCYLIEILEAGADGVICGCEHPRAVHEVYATWRAGEHETARALFREILPLLSWQFQSLECFIASVKTILAAKGVIVRSDLRDPHFRMGPRTRDALLAHALRVGALPGHTSQSYGAHSEQ